jgi:hypothetical protein
MMILKIYGLLGMMVFLLAIGPFWQDPNNPKGHLDQWLFLALAVALSPVVLPNMIFRYCRKQRITSFLDIKLP